MLMLNNLKNILGEKGKTQNSVFSMLPATNYVIKRRAERKVSLKVMTFH